MINSIYVDNIIKTALLEDINYLDVTTDYLIDEEQENTARFLAKDDGILCGIDIALRVFKILQPEGFEATVYKKDGDELQKGDIIAEIKGKTRTILKGERTALNLIQHMSGVATATNKAVKIIKGTNASIADTRKTLPGLRPLQKYAVTVGGGRNHRYNLSDAAMLKDNHVDAGGGIKNAVAKLKEKLGHMTKVELEVRNLDELGQALEAGVDVIMLDNMTCEMMRDAVQITGGKALLEASGNVTEDRLREIAETGVEKNDDMELVAVYTRRDPSTLTIKTPTAAVKSTADLDTGKEELDILVICGGSATDLPEMTPKYAAMYNVIDSFDTHARVPEHFANVDKAAKSAGKVGIISRARRASVHDSRSRGSRARQKRRESRSEHPRKAPQRVLRRCRGGR